MAQQEAQPTDMSGLQFVADNATTASTAASMDPLAPVALGGVDGKPVGHSLGVPRGFSISQVATGLRNPRFMAFDEAGNLLVADAQAGNVYRYPAAAGSIAPNNNQQ